MITRELNVWVEERSWARGQGTDLGSMKERENKEQLWGKKQHLQEKSKAMQKIAGTDK